MPDGIWVNLTAESVLFTCCPPAPEALKVSIRKSFLSTSISDNSDNSGRTATEQAEV